MFSLVIIHGYDLIESDRGRKDINSASLHQSVIDYIPVREQHGVFLLLM